MKKVKSILISIGATVIFIVLFPYFLYKFYKLGRDLQDYSPVRF